MVVLIAYSAGGLLTSILDRDGKGGGRYATFFSGHGAWGSGGRLRIYEELVRQNKLTAAEQAQFRKIVSEALEESFDYANSERSANNRPCSPYALTQRGKISAALRSASRHGSSDSSSSKT